MKTPAYSTTSAPPVACGFAAVILGAIALLFFFLPILSLPVSSAGMVLAAVGLAVLGIGGIDSPRLCVAGLLLSSCAFAIAWGIHLSPRALFSPRTVEPVLSPAADRLFIPPPAPLSASAHVTSVESNSRRTGEDQR